VRSTKIRQDARRPPTRTSKGEKKTGGSKKTKHEMTDSEDENNWSLRGRLPVETTERGVISGDSNGRLGGGNGEEKIHKMSADGRSRYKIEQN